jgi:hypothetical protein
MSMKESMMKKINPTDRELWFLKMAQYFKDGGKKVFQMESVEMCWPTEQLKKVYFIIGNM